MKQIKGLEMEKLSGLLGEPNVITGVLGERGSKVRIKEDVTMGAKVRKIWDQEPKDRVCLHKLKKGKEWILPQILQKNAAPPTSWC